jgi:hypothetical protein
MLAIVFIVGVLAALFTFLYFVHRQQTTSAGLLHAISGTLYIGVPALASIGFLMAGRVVLALGCVALTAFTVYKLMPPWRYFREVFPHEIHKFFQEMVRHNRNRGQVNQLRRHQSTGVGNRKTRR